MLTLSEKAKKFYPHAFYPQGASKVDHIDACLKQNIFARCLYKGSFFKKQPLFHLKNEPLFHLKNEEQ